MTTINKPDLRNQPPAAGNNTKLGPARKVRSILSAASHGAASVAKTHVLRKDRASQEQYEQRLDVCRDCPGKHATFKKDGSLHTCGPMLKSMADATAIRRSSGDTSGATSGATSGGGGVAKPCGCVLSKKAVDVKEDCPFGYWPTIESKPVVERREHPGEAARSNRPRILTPDRRIITPGTTSKSCSTCSSSETFADPSRRSAYNRIIHPSRGGAPIGRRAFLGKSIAAMVAATSLSERVFAVSGSSQYIRVEPCCIGEGTHVECSSVSGRVAGETFHATDNYQYKILNTKPIDSLSGNSVVVTRASGFQASCKPCPSSLEVMVSGVDRCLGCIPYFLPENLHSRRTILDVNGIYTVTNIGSTSDQCFYSYTYEYTHTIGEYFTYNSKDCDNSPLGIYIGTILHIDFTLSKGTVLFTDVDVHIGAEGVASSVLAFRNSNANAAVNEPIINAFSYYSPNCESVDVFSNTGTVTVTDVNC